MRDLPEVKHALPETTPQQVVLTAAVNAEETDDSDSDWLSDVTDVSANASTDLPSDDGDEEVLTRAQRKEVVGQKDSLERNLKAPRVRSSSVSQGRSSGVNSLAKV